MKRSGQSSRDGEDAAMLLEFQQLWVEAEAVWDDRQNEQAFGRYVSADYPVVCEALLNLRGRVHTILEWGSGLGVVTIMADLMGFDAYGIEFEEDLVGFAGDFAAKYHSNARFATGTFIPESFRWDPETGDEFHRTIEEGQSAYEELDMELRDFDLVYAYPWPTEYSLYRTILQRYGRPEMLLMTYDAREGLLVVRSDD